MPPTYRNYAGFAPFFMEIFVDLFVPAFGVCVPERRRGEKPEIFFLSYLPNLKIKTLRFYPVIWN